MNPARRHVGQDFFWPKNEANWVCLINWRENKQSVWFLIDWAQSWQDCFKVDFSTLATDAHQGHWHRSWICAVRPSSHGWRWGLRSRECDDRMWVVIGRRRGLALTGNLHLDSAPLALTHPRSNINLFTALSIALEQFLAGFFLIVPHAVMKDHLWPQGESLIQS